MRKTAAIVVTYNRKALLVECIASLQGQTAADQMDILIVDNASTDGTFEAIAKYIESGAVLYRNTGSNLGGAGGFQAGVRWAVEAGYETLWLMDDDSMPHADALEALLSWHDRLQGEYGFLCSRVLWTDGSPCMMNVQKTGLGSKVIDFSSPAVEVISSTFVSFFLKAETVRAVGLPIREFFIWCDDLEYSRRISLTRKCYLINESVVTHKCANNVGSNIALDSADRLSRYRYAYRNEVCYFRREGLAGWCYWAVRLVLHMGRILFKARDHRAERLRVLFSATREGLRFHPETEYV